MNHYWIMDPEARTLELYEAEDRKYRLAATHEGAASVGTRLFPALEIDLGRVWE